MAKKRTSAERTKTVRYDKALSENGNPSFATVLKVARALGLRLHAEAA